MNNKRVLYLLLCGMMLYYAVPRFPVNFENVQGVFALCWLLLAILAIGGNLSSLLFATKQTPHQRSNVRSHGEQKNKKHLRGRV